MMWKKRQKKLLIGTVSKFFKAHQETRCKIPINHLIKIQINQTKKKVLISKNGDLIRWNN